MKLKNSWLGFLALFAVLLGFVPARAVIAQTAGWSSPFRLSLDGMSWFPDIAADATGRVHVVWSSDTLNYRVWDGRGWSAMSEIAIAPDATGRPIADVFRFGITTDQTGYLNLFYYHLTEGIGYFTRAPSSEASVFKAWEAPQIMGARGQGYYSALAADKKNHLHAVYVNPSLDSTLADVYYRRSENEGALWTSPLNLSNSPRVGSSRPQILIDQFDTLHASWDEGWDRRSGEGAAQTVRYVFSTTGGRDWSVPVTFGNPKMAAAQLVVTAGPTPDSRIAVWRTTTDEAVYYQTSFDNGKNWGSPAPIPGILPRSWISPPFDQYAMARDDRGVVHLVLVTRRQAKSDLWAVTHLEWNGREWGQPETIFEREALYPEYPRIAIALGNQLHVVWFTRSALFSIAPMDIWHSTKTMNAQAYTPVPAFPTATPLILPPTTTPVPTPTRFVPPASTNVEPLPSPGSSSTIPMLMGLGAGVVVVGVTLWLRRLSARRDE